MRDARAVDRVPGGEIIGAVEDDVTTRDKLVEVLPPELFRKNPDVDFRIERRERFLRRLDFALADAIGAVEDLALEIREVDLVRIGEDEAPDAARCEV